MSNEYRSRIVTPEEAVSAVKSGDRVYVHNGCAEPENLLAALIERAAELRGVEIMHLATFGRAPYADRRYEGSFRVRSMFLGANVRQAVQEGRADYTPVFLSEIEDLILSGALRIDVAFVQCAPPGARGFLSLGPSVDVTHAALDRARHVIVEINDQVPRTHGESSVHVSRVHAFTECSHPLVEYRSHPITPVHRAIAQRLANLIPDGAVLQTGIGGLPEAMLGLLGNHKDLGIHSEMIPDGVVDLMESGVINNQRKSLNPGKAVTGFALGGKRLFDYIDDNPAFEFRRTSYVNDPFVIAQNRNMVAINSAIEVDLTGQVCADSVGSLPFSGIGGQVDFIRGAARSQGGLPIIALPSTAKDGAISRIVPTLRPGAGAVTSRGDVHWVITEFGAAYLHGKCLRERVEAMIAIADPKFREELERYAINVHLLGASRGVVAV
ncbi:MAG TPA: acetyl-CoA hydrolase/transferase C-terminal domain-containing protein [Bryobacteraceae bacterium]|nr:acetyl-CoA hydrolase/transferase C-terminal domain-containing protein [Bryobacteraceae bacterium]